MEPKLSFFFYFINYYTLFCLFFELSNLNQRNDAFKILKKKQHVYLKQTYDDGNPIKTFINKTNQSKKSKIKLNTNVERVKVTYSPIQVINRKHLVKTEL